MYQLYKDAQQQWRWRFVTNGNIIADSSQGYSNLQDAKRGIEIMKASRDAPVTDPSAGLLGGLMGH